MKRTKNRFPCSISHLGTHFRDSYIDHVVYHFVMTSWINTLLTSTASSSRLVLDMNILKISLQMTSSLPYPYLRNDNGISLHYEYPFMTAQQFLPLFSKYRLGQRRHIHDDIIPYSTIRSYWSRKLLIRIICKCLCQSRSHRDRERASLVHSHVNHKSQLLHNVRRLSFFLVPTRTLCLLIPLL